MLGEDDLLGPLEGVSVLIVGGNEGVDLLSYLARGGEAGAGQGMTGEDGKLRPPPGSARRRGSG
jgi:hypothetical protein